jgi:hypothetical protein
MARTKIVKLPDSFPAGKQVVDKIAPSTGPYGKRVAGSPPINAVKIRGRRK